uniref:methylenetetrahydrofolate reductase (NADPH) n=1 Tax=Romanomermis culicivorax TaxID=13658 RepID=A0A915JK93_ROMCU
MSSSFRMTSANNDRLRNCSGESTSSTGSSSLNDGHATSEVLTGFQANGQCLPVSVDANTEFYVPLDRLLKRRIECRHPFFSLEFFPPRTINGVNNLLNRLERMGTGSPLFVDVTWHPAGDPGSDKATSSMSIAAAALNYCGLETVLHVACANASKEVCLRHLRNAKKLGLRNILALRGDVEDERSYKGNDQLEMKYATNLVELIKEEFSDYFVIVVAGYPTGHPEADSYGEDLKHLKEKVDAGASFIITQLFFHEYDYFKFVQDCRSIGITVPIIPGIMPIQSYDSLRHMQKLSKLKVPQFIFDEVESVKQNDEAVRNYGVDLAVKMCRSLLQSGVAPGVHFYTLNRELATRQILQQLGLWKESVSRLLPWKPLKSHSRRCRETVRPIFWAACPKSYLYRTKDWDDFPNGRWGNSSSPAFGDLKDYYLFYLKQTKPKQLLLDMWSNDAGRLDTEEDVWSVFRRFISGETNRKGVKTDQLPFSEECIAAETSLVQRELLWCNENGILTVNSQPNINGAPSTDPAVGWGNPGGYVYQKAYLEFFLHQTHLDSLKVILLDYPLVNFHIVNHDRSIDFTNSRGQTPLAVTWGVFPGCEVAQPTVVDPISFHVWKDEAFNVWTNQWANIYEPDSISRSTLQTMHDDYCLVTLVDNDYPQPCCLWNLLRQMLTVSKRAHSSAADDEDGAANFKNELQNGVKTFDRLMRCSFAQNGSSSCLEKTTKNSNFFQ